MGESTIEQLIPDVAARLRAGGRVADFGCGAWMSGVELAQEFPRVRVDAVDTDQDAIETASWAAGRAGVSGRMVFHVATAEDAPLTGPYDLVTALDEQGDLAHSLRALRRMRQLASPGGTVLVAAAKTDTLIDAVYARAAGFRDVDFLRGALTARHFVRLTP
jgi:2-polyprenyl-3-methyl-5-hydroxy-6-metoxy-1,4-benzoquinol methylase